MNRERIKELAQRLREQKPATVKWQKEPIGFNMAVYSPYPTDDDRPDHTGHSCGTAACIAGHASLIWGQAQDRQITNDTIRNDAREVLDLDALTAESLFEPYKFIMGVDMESLTTCRAAAVLDHLADTGEVDWGIFDNDGCKVQP